MKSLYEINSEFEKAILQFCKVSNLADIEVCNYDTIYQRVKSKLKE